MRVTTWAEYGVLCAVHLARHATDRPISGRAIAAAEGLPADYVEQILLRLRRAGLVTSTRGAKGGYRLAREPRAISVRDVIAAADERSPFQPPCDVHPLDGERCGGGGECSVRPVWRLLTRRIDATLQAVTLADLVLPEPLAAEAIGLTPLERAPHP